MSNKKDLFKKYRRDTLELKRIKKLLDQKIGNNQLDKDFWSGLDETSYTMNLTLSSLELETLQAGISLCSEWWKSDAESTYAVDIRRWIGVIDNLEQIFEDFTDQEGYIYDEGFFEKHKENSLELDRIKKLLDQKIRNNQLSKDFWLGLDDLEDDSHTKNLTLSSLELETLQAVITTSSGAWETEEEPTLNDQRWSKVDTLEQIFKDFKTLGSQGIAY